ncbi:carboxypeptidase-like regulatory domain-containing protein [Veronia pacifica]|nr:carboxypeptidase-like regulatory domain-containing protein [Veronia pacifica]
MKKLLLILACISSNVWAEKQNNDDSYNRSLTLNKGAFTASVFGNTAVAGKHLYEKEYGHWTYKGELPIYAQKRLVAKSVSIHQHLIAIGHGSLFTENNKISIFKKNYSSWPYQWDIAHEIPQPSNASNLFGETVYIDNDLLAFTVSSKQVDIYTPVSGKWQFNRSLRLPDGTTGDLGTDIRREGDDLFVSVFKANRVNVYSISNEFMLTQQIQRPNDIGVYQSFGWSLDVEDEVLAISAYGYPGNVQIYNKDTEGNWTENQLLYSPVSDGYFGHDVELSDGQLFVGDDENKSIFQYSQVNDKWSLTNIKRGTSSDFGYAFDVEDGAMFVAGETNITLFTDDIFEVEIHGRVLDHLGTPLSDTTVSGYLSDAVTDESGLFRVKVPVGWSGTLSANKLRFSSTDEITLNWVSQDTDVSDLTLKYEGGDIRYSAYFYDDMCSADDIQFENINSRKRSPNYFSISLPYGWSGEIRPVSEHCQFTPESVNVDYALQGDIFIFDASER